MTHNILKQLKQTEAVQKVTGVEIQRKWSWIEQTMASCNMAGTIIQAIPGPVITQFELEIQKGNIDELCQQLEKYVSPKHLLARQISEKRFALDMPNDVWQEVSAYELFHSSQWQSTKMELPLMLGMGGNYAPVMLDLATAPQLLIGGATGSGKSVCMLMVIASLMLTHSPDELKFLVCDMKAVEFTCMAGSPYLLQPVITDIEQSLAALKALEAERRRRLSLFEAAEVKDIAGYNKAGKEHLPGIAVVLDEFADMMCSEKHLEFKQRVIKLTRIGHITGIYVILASQRPDAKVFPQDILACFSTRIAFRVANDVDSQLLLEETGAEKLLGRGDMLLKTPTELKRLQVGYLSCEELGLCVKTLPNDTQDQFTQKS